MTSPGSFRRDLRRAAAHLCRTNQILAGVVPTTPGLFTPKRYPGLGAATGPAGRQNARKSIFFVGSSPGGSAAVDHGGRNVSQTGFWRPLITQKCGKARGDLQTVTKRSKKQKIWFMQLAEQWAPRRQLGHRVDLNRIPGLASRSPFGVRAISILGHGGGSQGFRKTWQPTFCDGRGGCRTHPPSLMYTSTLDVYIHHA